VVQQLPSIGKTLGLISNTTKKNCFEHHKLGTPRTISQQHIPYRSQSFGHHCLSVTYYSNYAHLASHGSVLPSGLCQHQEAQFHGNSLWSTKVNHHGTFLWLCAPHQSSPCCFGEGDVLWTFQVSLAGWWGLCLSNKSTLAKPTFFPQYSAWTAQVSPLH
jgi:hypothetical protein